MMGEINPPHNNNYMNKKEYQRQWREKNIIKRRFFKSH
jgi:hypothetical protein